jgi:flagellar motor switch protein FliM
MLTRQIQTAEVEVVATLGATSITLDKVVDLKVGDVIPIEIGDTVQATVDGVPIMESRYGIQNGQYALKIERFLAEEDA